MVFFLGGLVLMPSVLAAIFDFGAALPWLTASLICVGLGGFEIWHADHPSINPRHALLSWIGRVVAGIGIGFVLLLGRAYPWLGLEIGVGLGVLWVALLVVISRLESGSKLRGP